MAVDFAKLKNLKILDLSGQRVKSIPDSIFKLKLSELNLAQNQIGQSEQDKIKKSLPGTTVRF
jgi:Leucine-rich repeat (LRR) protein